MIRIVSDKKNLDILDRKDKVFTTIWGEDLETGKGIERSQCKTILGIEAYWFLVGYMSRNPDRDPEQTMSAVFMVLEDAVTQGEVQYSDI